MGRFVLTQSTRRFVRQARERLGLGGALALGFDGCPFGWPRLGPGAAAGPEGVHLVEFVRTAAGVEAVFD